MGIFGPTRSSSYTYGTHSNNHRASSTHSHHSSASRPAFVRGSSGAYSVQDADRKGHYDGHMGERERGWGSGSYSRSRHSSPSRSWFGSLGGGSRTSAYRRRPRDGYIQWLMYKLRTLFRDLIYHARKNPVKVFFMVVMPLISGGVLAGFARQFGIRLPAFLQGNSHGASRMSGGYYGSSGYSGSSGFGRNEGLGGLANMMGGGGGGGLSSVMSIAKHFL